MNGAGPLWVIGWLAAGITVPALLVTAYLKLQDRRYQREAAQRRRAHRDAAFCAAHGIDWHAERTP